MKQPDVWGILRENGEFRKLWLAQLGSNAGDWFNDVAVLASVALVGAAAWSLLLLTDGGQVGVVAPAEASGE